MMKNTFTNKRISLISISMIFVLLITFQCTDDENSVSRQDGKRKVEFQGDSLHFVGVETCAGCHATETEEWLNSHHDLAMKPAGADYVLGDFENTIFEHKGDTYRFFREDSTYKVEAPGADGKPGIYDVSYTFGWTPLQQYLIDFGKGKYQALNIAWDTEQEKWFALNPEEDIVHGDWLHWTGGAMNWNTMCADCHSTNLKQNYFPETDSFHTTWSEINVSCEACHGAGSAHVAFMHSDDASQATLDRIRRDLKLTGASTQDEILNQCASCHSLREKLTPVYPHDGQYLDHYSLNLPHPEAYFPDGQIRDEVYVFASFLQSKMYKEGVQCMDCHNPHTLELLLPAEDNQLCMQCHEPKYNDPGHHFHEVETRGAQCISCHMPGRYYMEVDFRHDHSFRIPRPDLSTRFGTPNACNDCHQDKSAEWAARAVENWYGSDRPEHHSETWLLADSMGAEAIPQLSQLLQDTSQNEIVRATTAWYLGQFPAPENADILAQYLQDPSSMVRNSAVRAIANLPEDMRRIDIQEAFADPVRAVRIGASRARPDLTDHDISPRLRSRLKTAREEYLEYLHLNQYFPAGQMNLGLYYESTGDNQKAIRAYEEALKKDGYFNAARMNLAFLYNQSGQNKSARELFQKVISQEPDYGPAHYYLALLKAEEDDIKGALPHFEEAARRMPENARVRYNWAISLQTLQLPLEAEKVYRSALQLEPENPDFIYGLITLYLQQNQHEKALPYAEQLVRLQPQNQQFQQMLQLILSHQ